MVVALILLGLGWSGAVLAGSSLLATITPPHIRVPLQGASDALMNYAGAGAAALAGPILALGGFQLVDRKSTRLNSSHVAISYAVFCLKKKKSSIRSRHMSNNIHT